VRALQALQALDRGPPDAVVKLGVARWTARLGDLPGAERALAAARACDPPLLDAPFEEARLLADAEPARALAVLRVPAVGPSHVAAESLRVQLLLRLGRVAEARDTADRALAELPSEYALLGARVSVAVTEGDRAAALAGVDRMRTLPEEARVRQRARVLEQLGDVDGAMAALVAGPCVQPETWALGGEILTRAGRPAVEWLSDGAARAPSAAVLAGLARASSAAGRSEEARAAWGRAVALDPTNVEAALGGGGLEVALDRHPGETRLLRAVWEAARARGAWAEAARAAAVWGRYERGAAPQEALREALREVVATSG